MTVNTLSLQRCDECFLPVTSGSTGCYWVDLVEVKAVEAGRRAFDAAHPNGAMIGELIDDYPEDARWRLTHDACRDTQVMTYDIGLPADHAAWLRWASHMMGKTWISATNFDELLRSIAGEGLAA